ncbi:hypothetical protein ENSA7_53780 [Enhygromyxa salina]|uniref:Uncharacterized protein n=1 Tax=Enhygromyxa salina TaxID=215803 RepID=A0A2S9YDB6_9BACT|nr:hypothetical protein ENSA7_53780 [Enhygromyxa salina]
MTSIRPTPTLLLLVLSSCLLGCNQRPLDPDSTEADAGMPPDVGGVMGDPWNCGEEQLSCVGPLGIGDCIDGKCQGRLSTCWESGASCTALCEELGASCDASCEGAAAFGWAAETENEALAMCVEPFDEGASPLSVTCEQPLPFADYSAIRCCCR